MLSNQSRVWPLLLVLALFLFLGKVLVYGVRTATAVPLQTPTNFDEVYVNFSASSTVPPSSYLRDHGQAYAVRTGTYQGGGIYSYGWVAPGTSTPKNLNGYGLKRSEPGDVRLASFMQMHYSAALEGSWEIALPNGMYSVTVAVGDSGLLGSQHWLSIENQAAIVNFLQASTSYFMTATQVVWVNDGRLTLHQTYGSNTKINYVDIISNTLYEQRPSVTASSIAHTQIEVPLDAGITVSVDLPNGAITPTTVTTETMRLTRIIDGNVVTAVVNISGSGDALVLQPLTPLVPGATYLFEVTEGVKDISGATLIPFQIFFTTATGLDPHNGSVAFDQILVYSNSQQNITTVALGPDGKLYAGTLTGLIFRFDINPDGTLTNQQTINTVRTANGGNRAILGMAFDPAATAENLILWLSNNNPNLSNAPPWSDKISRLTGANLENIEDVVINLPHSYRDHMTNGMVFGPDDALYFLQGSNTSTGAPDDTWGLRPERLLTAAVLRLEATAVITSPLDVQTSEGGTYDPFAPDAPLTIYASGTRNAYDLVWHSNGNLYVPTNGSRPGGNTPSTPAPLPIACQTRRLDLATNGIYTGPQVISITEGAQTLNDYLFRVEAGGYYGHPNPERCEWVLNGGNPTAGDDKAEVYQYPIGIEPDRNWRGAAFDFGLHASPNGVIEYQSGSFDGYLQGKLLVVRYSLYDDIVVLVPGQPDGDIVAIERNISGFTGLTNPLDIVENPTNGHLYVASIYPGRIRLLRPLEADVSLHKTANVITAVPNQILTYTFTISNAGPTLAANLVITDVLPAGLGLWQLPPFCNSGITCTLPALPAGQTTTFQIGVQVLLTEAATITNTAVVRQDTYDGALANGEDTAVFAVTPAHDLQIEKEGAELVLLGDDIQYTLTLTNAGPSLAMGVVVTDVLPPNVVVADLSPACIAGVSVVCVLGDMTVGQTAVITLTVTPTQTGFVTNTAVVVGSDVELVPANNEAAVGTLVTLISDLSIHKMASSAWLNLAEPLTYTLLITNNGPSMATNVVVTDVLPVGMSLIGQSSDCVGVLVIVCNVGDLAMGGTAAFTVTVTPTATGIFTNTAVVLGNESDMDMSNNAAEVGTAVLPVIDLAIAKTGSSDWLYVGHILTYSLSISNSGPSPATGVIVTDNLPANVVILGMSEDCMPAIDDIVCGIGDMTVGETAVFTITVTPTTTGVLTNTAVVQGHEADANEINNEDGAVTAVLPVTDLVIEKTGSSDWLYVGETLMYSLVISNSGPSPATNVVVTDSLPANVVVQGMSGDCAGISVVVCDVGNVAVGGTAVFTITVAPITAGVFTNTAVIMGNEFDEDTGNNGDEAVTVVLPLADITLHKQASGSEVVIGRWLTYTLTITNEGPSTATGVVVTDSLPAHVILVSASPGCSGSLLVVCPVVQMDVGETAVFTLTVTPITTDTLMNTAQVTAREYDPIASNNRMDVTTTVLLEPFFVLLTGASDGMVGQVMTFTAVAGPLTTTQPITYIWQSAGQTTVTHTNGLTDVVAFKWDEAGEWVVRVTAVNHWGTVTTQQLITVSAYHSYLPLVIQQE